MPRYGVDRYARDRAPQSKKSCRHSSNNMKDKTFEYNIRASGFFRMNLFSGSKPTKAYCPETEEWIRGRV